MLTNDLCRQLKDFLIEKKIESSFLRLSSDNLKIFQRFIVDNPGFYEEHIMMYDKWEHLSNDYLMLEHDGGPTKFLLVQPMDEKYGVTCIKCLEFYPHALDVPAFKCWGCRNF